MSKSIRANSNFVSGGHSFKAPNVNDVQQTANIKISSQGLNFTSMSHHYRIALIEDSSSTLSALFLARHRKIFVDTLNESMQKFFFKIQHSKQSLYIFP